jgi:hypothetical protein
VSILVSCTPGSRSRYAYRRAARADMELEMIESDFAHRQAFRRLKALMSPTQ